MAAYEDVEEAFNDTLLVGDPHLLPVLLATVLSHYADGDPVWLMLIGAPSTGKTEYLRALSGVPDYLLLSDVTPKTFFSGWERDDKRPSSLLKQFPNPLMVANDFSGIFAKREADQSEILTQLRQIYDGKYAKRTGTGDHVVWAGKATFLAAATDAIDGGSGRLVGRALGERFLDYRPLVADGLEEEAVRYSGKEAEQRNMRGLLVQSFLEQYVHYGTLPRLSDKLRKPLPSLARFVAAARSAVEYDRYTKEVTVAPSPERGARMVKQLIRLGEALQHMDTGLDIATVLRRVALDSVPPLKLRILQQLNGKDTKTAQVARGSKIPLSTVKRVLQELEMFGLVESWGGTQTKKWRLSTDTKWQNG